ncbi:MAG: hypothetical protein ACLQAT_00060 [Candidatus Binataceae bacterium]
MPATDEPRIKNTRLTAALEPNVKENVFAYGFDQAGFQTSGTRWDTPRANITWIPYSESRRLDDADGVVTVQGIFEQIRIESGFSGPHANVRCDRELMLERDRQVRNLVERGGWICFLVGMIIDQVPDNSDYRTRSITNTDLCKIVLESEEIERSPVVSGLSSLRAVRNEFVDYVRQHGVAKTIFHLHKSQSSRALIQSGSRAVGLVVGGRIFFLPFATARKDDQRAKDVVSLAADSIIDYRRKENEETPTWIDRYFRFRTEEQLLERLQSLEEQATATREELRRWTRYKRILAASGDRLTRDVVSILQEFFHLEVNPFDEGHEDFKIKLGAVVCIGEAKGTNSGIQREYINQVDSHRERSNLTQQMPGLPIINDQMNIASIDQRSETTVPKKHIVHARAMNVLIVRTVDLLFLMRHTEQATDRNQILASALTAGGGWLAADESGFHVITD